MGVGVAAADCPAEHPPTAAVGILPSFLMADAHEFGGSGYPLDAGEAATAGQTPSPTRRPG